MTNAEIEKNFREKHPSLEISDFRPLSPVYTKDLIGITIWLKNGDVLQYYPKEAQIERSDKE